MRTRQRSSTPIILVAVILVAVIIIGLLVWLLAANVFVGGKMYPKNTQFLNLRGETITLKVYDELREKLPDCEIYWDIPFQGKTYPENTVVLTVTELTEKDVNAIGYFEHLEVVDAMECDDYAEIQMLCDRYPDVVVGYMVNLSGKAYPTDTTEVALTSVTEQEIAALKYLPEVTAVDVSACTDYTLVGKLMEAYPQAAVTVKLGDATYSSDTSELTITGMTDAEADALAFFSNLKMLHLVDPVMDPQKLIDLTNTYTGATITWEVDVLGVNVRSDATELNLMEAISPEGAKAYEMAASATINSYGLRDETVMLFAKKNKYPIPDMTAKTGELIEQVEKAMAYFPSVKKVNMCGAFFDNEAMAAFREAHREDYKVVWTVDCGKMVASTDTTYFMPFKFGVAYFFDENTYNLRYCEDIEAIDLGHMSIHNADFAAFMPNLKYLVLAHTQVADITPLKNCKSLLFLELDWSLVKDYTPLKGCTALEDLNLSDTFGDIDPVLEMSWLKHLWIINRGDETQARLRETFGETETVLYLEGDASVSGGWRELPNYFAMREALNMKNMEW